ncbi:MAG: chemotaxis protein CheB [Phormidesmis sp.]
MSSNFDSASRSANGEETPDRKLEPQSAGVSDRESADGAQSVEQAAPAQDTQQSNGQQADPSFESGSDLGSGSDSNLDINSQRSNSFLTVGIGASAGGLEAFQTFFRQMNENSGMAFVLISHLAPDHDSLLSELLAKETQMSVLQVTEEVRLQPNQVYVIPPNATLTVDDGILRLSTPVQARGHRAPINIFFRSLAEDQGENAVCVILSGTGSDGTIGMKSIKEFGGLAIAQDSETAKYDSMPRNAVMTGLVDYVLPVEDIPDKLVEYARHREGLQANLGEDGMLPQAADYLKQICSLLRRRIGHDFGNYKQGTLIRRIQRRIQITQTESVEAYVNYLKSDAEEISLLFKDLLIGVTHFFRDPDAFEALQQSVVSTLVEESADRKSIRIWITGCSSGEEVYSIAMLVAEEIDRQNVQSQVQIFATDIDEQALEKARHARYPESIAEQITPERLDRFFIKQDGLYQVAKPLREMCIFSQHSLISDPPFSRLDLISCRNLLIYFDSDLQKRLMPLFHCALREGGYLFLGSSENLTAHGELFRTTNKSYRIFQRKQAIVPPQIDFPLVDRSNYRQLSSPKAQQVPSRQSQISKSIERVLLQDYSPACVIINEQNEIVYFFGRTGKYFEPSQGAPSNNLFDLARLGLRLDLRAALQSARESQREAIRERVSVENEEQIITLNLIVRPVNTESDDDYMLMVIFQDVGKPTSYEKARADGNQPEEETPVIRQLEDELRITKEHLKSTVEGVETSNEELKSANEELLSMNEELQSSNEELQTSKEEMQSINEELETVNTELRNKVEELDAANSDIQNLFESTRIATVFLDERLRIKRFTPAVVELFHLIGTDVGRPITDISLSLEGVDIVSDVRSVLQSLIPIEREVRIEDQGTYYKMRIMPYRTLENVINGTVLTFVDVTSLRQARNRAERWAQRQSAIAALGTYALQDNSAAAVCDRAVDIVCQTLESKVCGLFVYQPQHPEELLLQSGSGWPADALGQATMSVNNSHLGYTLSVHRPVVVRDFSEESRFSQSSLLQSLDVVSGMSAVVYGIAGEVYGMLTVYKVHSHRFTPEDTSFLQAIANDLSAALQREQTTLALEKSRGRLDLAIDAGNMGIWELDITTGKSTWNAIEYGLLGLTPDEIAEPDAELFYRYVHPEDVQSVQQKVATAIEQETEFEAEFRISREGSPLRWLAAKARVISDAEGNALKMIGVNYDITERKQNEESLKESDRRKDDFLATLGHELRNPLNALSSSIALMQQSSEELSAPESVSDSYRQQMQTVASRQLRQLTRLVDDLLDVSRIAYQKIQLKQQRMDFAHLLRDLVVDAESTAAGKGISINTALPDAPIWIDGDLVRLMQAFSNVLQNAIKFSNSGSSIEISTAVEAEFVTTKVADAGIGMEPEALSRIFTAFSQEDRSLARSGGLGLGLPLARGIVELHGGQIWAESLGIGRGTTLIVRLPYSEAIAATEPVADASASISFSTSPSSTSPSTQSPSTQSLSMQAPSTRSQRQVTASQSKRILVIEDNGDSAMVLQIYLEGAGYQVTLADDGKSGVTLARQLQPSVIISDIGLTAAMDGYAVAQAVRSEASLSSIYMIATSGYGQPEDKSKAKAAGFDEHLTKPINLKQVEALIARHISAE